MPPPKAERGGRVRATPPCAQRSVSPAEAARPQQPRKSAALAPSLRAQAPLGLLLGLCVAASTGAARRREGGRGLRGARDRCGLGPARTMQGEGCRKGVCARRRGARLSRFLPSPTPKPRGARGPPGSRVPARLGLETELSVRPAVGFRKGGRGRVDPEKRACWKEAKRKEWIYENKRGNPRGPECVRERLAVGRCGYERDRDLGSNC